MVVPAVGVTVVTVTKAVVVTVLVLDVVVVAMQSANVLSWYHAIASFKVVHWSARLAQVFDQTRATAAKHIITRDHAFAKPRHNRVELGRLSNARAGSCLQDVVVAIYVTAAPKGDGGAGARACNLLEAERDSVAPQGHWLGNVLLAENVNTLKCSNGHGGGGDGR